MTNPISGDGYKVVKIDIGHLNNMNEPYVVKVGENAKFILRFKCTAKDDDYGTLTLEAMAD